MVSACGLLLLSALLMELVGGKLTADWLCAQSRVLFLWGSGWVPRLPFCLQQKQVWEENYLVLPRTTGSSSSPGSWVRAEGRKAEGACGEAGAWGGGAALLHHPQPVAARTWDEQLPLPGGQTSAAEAGGVLTSHL